MEQEQQEKMEQKARQQGAGTLYLCATPIGNLEDMTYRAVRMLGEVPLIAAEDTRHTRQLLTHFDIHTKLTSYHEHNKFTKGPELIEWLLSGQDLICVSDAGLPGICDPGSHLAELAIKAGIRVSPLPGCNAGLSALICSGLDTTRFTFVGFLPKTAKKQQEVLSEVKNHRETLIFYEAPHHLKATLRQLAAMLGGTRRAAFGRELTKKFEEFRRGTLQDLLNFYEENEPRGEYVLIVEGFKGEAEPSQELPADPVELCKMLMEDGLSKKEAMREAAKKLGISRRDVYAALLTAEK
ncbi:16S rRNA (cytidine(1402)-2'-O)-methyltransferase [Mitsuokella sp.]|uniref:16S rRNA (cytidine(1402)-2'-O)-methyltransferase n=1 Tax=Mitsuokella sp. TaxID=2049034 RepID=UPI003D7D9A28